MQKQTFLLMVISSLTLMIAQAEELKVDTPIPAQKPNSVAEALFNSSDINHDGAISKIEFYDYYTQHNTKSFKVLDVNKDGKLTPDELQHAW
ncbi:MAG: hypothetical protein ABL902_01025 [Gallionella sp.]